MTSHPSWSDIEAAVTSDPPSPAHANDPHASSSSRSARRPSTWRTNDKDVTDLGPERLDDKVRLWKCDHCGKPVLARYKGYHKQNCDLARAIAENRISRSVLEPDPNKLKRTFHDFSDSSSQGDNDDASTNASPQKKLTKKAARALEVEERKRVRLENKARKEQEAAEAKGRRKKGQPLDVNRQCGVINDNGQPCQRSLTCKTHAMGAKRAVPGRCKPYDELLLEWQKANNPAFLAKLEKKEEERAKAMEEKRVKKLEKKKKKDAAAAAAAANAASNHTGKDSASHMLGPGGKKLVIGPDGQAGNWITHPDGTKTFLASRDPNATALHADKLTSEYANDLFTQDVDSSAIASEVKDLLGSLSKHYTDDALAPLPLVPRRTYHGMYTSQVKRFLMMRQSFASTSSNARSQFSHAPAANGTSSIGSWAGGGLFASHT